MAQIAPPQAPPWVTLSDDDGMKGVHFSLWQLLLTTITILATGWFVTLGVLPAILSILVAKHVLVAILMIGLDRDAGQVRT